MGFGHKPGYGTGSGVSFSNVVLADTSGDWWNGGDALILAPPEGGTAVVFDVVSGNAADFMFESDGSEVLPYGLVTMQPYNGGAYLELFGEEGVGDADILLDVDTNVSLGTGDAMIETFAGDGSHSPAAEMFVEATGTGAYAHLQVTQAGTRRAALVSSATANQPPYLALEGAVDADVPTTTRPLDGGVYLVPDYDLATDKSRLFAVFPTGAAILLASEA